MTDDEKLDRAARRRQEKEAAKGKATCTECEEGPCDVAPKTYDKCPVCGCPATFVVKAMKGDLHLEDIRNKQAALFSFEYLYDTPTQNIKLMAVGASCARCGVLYTLARDKMKGSPLVVPKKPRGDGPDLILPGHAG